jgi:predicted NBD/HSP70 family sugar kinase
VTLTGVANRERGILVDAPYLGWSSLDIAGILQPRLGMPVVVDRITSALLAAEIGTSRSVAQRSPVQRWLCDECGTFAPYCRTTPEDIR